MLNLYKTDLKRILKDKLFLVALILGAVFAVINPLMNKLLFDVLLDADDALMDMIGMDAKSMFFSSFSPSNNLGLIAPVLLGIALCKDFSFGTVRNKIISGKPRTSVFLSYFLSCATALCALIFLHAALTLGISLLFFEYPAFDPGYLLFSLLLELLVYLCIAALVSFLCVFMKNAGLAIVVYVAANFLFTVIGSIVSIAFSIIDPSKELLRNILQFLDRANIFMGTYIGVTPEYDTFGILSVLVGALSGIALFLLLGILSFRKKDLK